MAINFQFRRFDRKSQEAGFHYQSTEKQSELEHAFNSVNMNQAGFTIHTVIKNYLAEDVFLGGSLRSEPTRIKSLLVGSSRPRSEYVNHIVVTIYSTEINDSTDPRKRITHNRKTEIKIPGKMLNQGSVFVDELDCYLTTDSQIDATRELIARDVRDEAWESINLPESLIRHEPSIIYSANRELIKACVEHQDRIQIRIGLDLQYDILPDIVKQFRISVVDSYFIPFKAYKLVYDPNLGADDFVLENIYVTSKGEYRSTFTELARDGSIFLDHNEVKTLFGSFHSLGIFANAQRYCEYVHRRKAQERFDDESLYLADRSGDPRLKEEINRLERQERNHLNTIENHEKTIARQEDELKQTKKDLKSREEALAKLRARTEEKMEPSYIVREQENEDKRIELDIKKLEHEREELEQKAKTSTFAHKATMLKAVGEIVKSSWAIVAACSAGVLSIIAVCKKYDVKLTVGA